MRPVPTLSRALSAMRPLPPLGPLRRVPPLCAQPASSTPRLRRGQPGLTRMASLTLGAALAAVLAACSTASHTPAPVEERTMAGRPRPANNPSSNPSSVPADARASAGAENAGKPGYYTVRAGDTLVRIGLDSGQNWRDLARWNRLDNPNLIEVGQVIRVAPPVGELVTPRAAQSAPAPAQATAASAQAAAPSVATTAPVIASNVQAQAMGPVGSASGPVAPLPAGSPAQVPQAPPVPEAAGHTPTEDEVAWSWPIPGAGNLLAGFDEVRNKGLDIGGKAGDPVLAAADGRVVYAGSGLRGYGNLVILKHNNTYLTAYAHNQNLLVKEDQAVVKGQRIAEMGSSDADRVKLHFEIRKQGKPVDPSKYLPSRP